MDPATRLLNDSTQLKAFLLATKRGIVNEVCKEFGMSPAAYYRFIDKVVAGVATAQRLAQTTSDDARKLKADLLLQRLRALVLAHPTWGCDRLAANMCSESPISGPTVQKLLNQEGLKGRRDRITYLVNTIRSGEIVTLSDEQMHAIGSVSPALIDTLRIRTPEVMDIVELHIPIARRHGECNYVRLYIVLDSYFTLAEVRWNTGEEIDEAFLQIRNGLRLTALAQAAGFSRRRIYTYGKVTSPASVDSDSDNAGLHSTSAVNTLIQRGMVRLIGREIERRLFANQPAENPLSPKELESALNQILLEYNTQPAEPVCLFQGKSPAEIMGLSDVQTNEFLTKQFWLKRIRPRHVTDVDPVNVQSGQGAFSRDLD